MAWIAVLMLVVVGHPGMALFLAFLILILHKMLAEGRDNPHTFNGIELELTWEDLDELEATVREGRLPPTRGFFFGDGADDHYRDADLEFIKKARAELFTGLRVFYNSSW